MSKLPSVSNVTTSFGSSTPINESINALQAQFARVLFLDGTSPNAMEADLDMDSNDLLNAGRIDATSLFVNGVKIVSANSVFSWRGQWTTATAYALDNVVRQDGSSYICVTAHTSGTFSADLSAGNWELFVSQGTTGPGNGDLLAANNLSELADADTALSNLGAATAGLTVFKNTDVLYVDDTNDRVGIGTATPFSTLHILGNPPILRMDNSTTSSHDRIQRDERGIKFQIDHDNSEANSRLSFDVDGVAQGEINANGWRPVAFQAGSGGFLDEDDMVSDSATAVPSQQSVKAYVDAAIVAGVGVGQTWTDVSGTRSANTWYQNTTGQPIQVNVSIFTNLSSLPNMQVSPDGSTGIVTVARLESNSNSLRPGSASFIVPNGHFYRMQNAPTSIYVWAELR